MRPTHSWAIVGTELCLALDRLGYDLAVHSTNGSTYIHPNLINLISTDEKAKIGLGYTIPRNLKLFQTEKKLCIYNYETTILPPGWAKEINMYADLILPSSNFARDVFIKNGVSKDKAVILPHGVDTSIYNPSVTPMNLNTEKFKFLCVAQAHDRKGLDILLKAYAEEFASTENVVLIIKTNQISNQNPRAHYEIDVQQLLRQTKQQYAMPEVRLITERLDSIASLYTACDAFVLPTRSECFALPILEAMVCKVPVIATGYSGHTDFATAGNSYQISYKMIAAPKSMQYWHYDARAQIAEPSVEHLRSLMRFVYKNYDKAQQKAELAYEQVIDRYTWDNVARQFSEILQQRNWLSLNVKAKGKSTVAVQIDLDRLEQTRMQSYYKALSRKREQLLELEKDIVTKQIELGQLQNQIQQVEQQCLYKYSVLEKPFSNKISIIVLTYNTKDLTKKCIESILSNTKDINYKLLVIDNNSTDGTIDYLKENNINYIANTSNVGVSKGWNQGIALSDLESDVVVLNSDIVVSNGWLSELSKAAYEDNSVGVVGCRMIKDYQGRKHILHTGAIIKRDGMGEENEWGIPLPDYGQYKVNQDVQIVVGACMYLKRELINKVGLFDESFSPAYFEDSDFCLKTREAGYKVLYCGKVTLYHEHNATSRINNINASSLLQQNRVKFLKKWKPYLDKKDLNIELRGPVFAASGYAEACRNLAIGLTRENVNVALKPITSHVLEQGPKGNANLIIQDLITNDAVSDTSLIFYLADFFTQHPRGKKRKIGYTMLEVDGVPANWVAFCNDNLTELWVPSTFNKQTFQNSGVKVPIKVMPLSIDIARFNPYIDPLLPINKEIFRFLSVCEMGERKNVHLLMRAFQAEFKKDEPVQLLLKISNHDATMNVEKELQQYDLRNVVLLSQSYDLHQMPSLYRSVDCFVLASSGEGWGLPYMEAMAVGLPTIGTAWSANVDFMNNDNSYLIRVKELVPAIARCKLYSGFKWALPDIDHLKQLMRHVYENRDEALIKGQKASRHVSARYSLSQIGKIAKGYLM